MEAAPHPWPALGVLLLRDGLVEKQELEDILSEQQDARQRRLSGRRLGELLVQRGRVTPEQVARLVAEQYELPYVDFDVADIDVHVARILSEDDARSLSAIPISRSGDGTYLLAIADPSTVLFSDELRRLLGSAPRFAVVGAAAIERAIEYVHRDSAGSPAASPVAAIAVEPADPDREAVLLSFPASSGSAFELLEARLAEAREEQQTSPLLGALLVRDGFITEPELETALAQQRLSPSHRLGEILVDKGLVDPAVIARLVAEQYELRYFDVGALDVDHATAALLPEDIARSWVAVPIAQHDDGSLDVAISDPTRAAFSDELHDALGAPLTIVVAAPGAIEALLDQVHAPAVEQPVALEEVEVEVAMTDVDSDPTVAERLDETLESVFPLAAPPADTEESAPASWLEEQPPPEDPAEMPSVAFVLDTYAAPSEDEAVTSESLDETLAPIFSSAAAPADAADEEAAPASWFEPAEVHDDRPQESHADVIDLFAQPALDEPPLSDPPASAEPDAFEPPMLEELPAFDLPAPQEPDHCVPPMLEELPGFDLPAPEEPDHCELSLREELEEAEPTIIDLVPFAAEEDAIPEPEVPTEVVFDIFGIASTPVFESDDSGSKTVAEPPVPDEPPVPTDREDEPMAEPVAENTEPAVAEDVEPAVPTSDSVLDDALAAGATIFHLSYTEDSLVARARVDGLVRELGLLSAGEGDAFVARLEADGAAHTHVVETSRGRKTTVFVRAATPPSLDELGLSPDAAATLRRAIGRPAGAVVFCGPTGGGVSTTLSAVLDALATGDRVVTALKHPVERLLEGVDQIDVDPANGLTFAGVLREALLTDPDVLLVSDVSDRETAALALQAAYDGRLVVAALHAPGAVAALFRLLDLGVEHAALAACSCVVSQRLVRTVCTRCLETYYASADELAALGQPETGSPRLLARGTGCEHCAGTGFRGRTGLFEVLPVTGELRKLLTSGASAKKIQKAAAARGMRTLREAGVLLCLDGVTTVDEVARVLGDEL